MLDDVLHLVLGANDQNGDIVVFVSQVFEQCLATDAWQRQIKKNGVVALDEQKLRGFFARESLFDDIA